MKIMARTLVHLFLAVLVVQTALTPPCLAELSFKGVSLAGAEFGEGNLPGTFNQHYTYPNSGEVDYFMSRGMNTMRLPFRWERLQRSKNAALDSTELGRMNNFIDYTTGQGGHVILDPHNYARYYGDLVGSSQVSNADFANFWTRVADEYKDNPRVVFGLMNEPNTMPTEQWLSAANEAIAAIRATGAQNLIMVPGNGWSGAHSWNQNWYGTPNAQAMLGIQDPLNNYAIEVHQYLDSDSSGTSSAIVNQNIGQQRLVDFTNWLKTNNLRGFLGEFAAANSTIGNGAANIGDEAINNMLSYVEANDDVWMGWNWWAAGPWWGDYLFTLEPNGQDRPAMDLLEPWLTETDIFLPGDYDDSGVVDAADFTVWQDHLGTNTWLPGDTTPGLVSAEDYDVWFNFFGTEQLPYSTPSVPEPTTAALALLSCLCFFHRHRKTA
jgi:endoglucanase